MIAQALTRAAHSQALIPAMTCLGLLVFFTFFIGMLFWTSRREKKTHYASMSQMPLEGNKP